MLGIWSLRRVLLAGMPDDMLRAMEAQLCALGARAFQASCDTESLSRTLQQQRSACVIVPDLFALGPCSRIDALNTLLFEAREAGVPLVMLLSRMHAAHDGETVRLFSHALGFSRGAFGDPVSVQCIRYKNTQAACRESLMLGARFLSGERSCTGVFTLDQDAGRHPSRLP